MMNDFIDTIGGFGPGDYVRERSLRWSTKQRSRYPGVDITSADAASLSHRDETSDAVTIGFCLHHVADARAVHAEVNRVLRSGGRVGSDGLAHVANPAVIAAASKPR